MLKPNCSECHGCNYELRDIGSAEVQFQHIHFTHGAGATSNWMFFASRPGEADRSTVKVFCIPIDKRSSLAGFGRRGARVTHLPINECSSKTASDRLELLLIQQRLAEECGVQEIFPRLWVSKISAVMPGLNYHVRWYGVWMEEARGITLFALHTSKDKKLALRLFQQNLNRTQVMLGAIWDVFTAQCDRHSENIFVDDAGQVQYIDNDKALGAVSRCGYDSMLIPGTRYHSVLRIGFWHQLAIYYRNLRKEEGAKLCRGMVDPRVVIDYRCSVPEGKIGLSYPPNIERCLKKYSEMSIGSLVEDFGMDLNRQPAEIISQRARDMITIGFEETMERGAPNNSIRFKMPHQPPCCNIAVVNRQIMCESCWQPLLPEDFSNSTDLTLVSSLVSRNRGSDQLRDAELSRMQLNRG